MLGRFSRAWCGVFIPLILFAVPATAQTNACLDGTGEAAISACSQALGNTDLLTPAEESAFLRARAGHALALGRDAEALADLKALAGTDTASARHHYRMALALHRLGRPADQVTAALTRALELDPHHVESLVLQADIALAADDPDTAMASAGLAATLAPDSAEANQMMAAALEAVGARDAAARSIEAAQNTENTEATDTGTNTDTGDTGTTAMVGDETRPATGSDALELTFWNDVKDSTDPAELQAFLAAFPDSVFRPLAELRLTKLGQTDLPETTGDPDVTTQVAAKPEENPEAKPALPPTTALELRFGTEGDNMVLHAEQMANGNLIVAGSRTPYGEDKARPWLARLDASGTVIWEDGPRYYATPGRHIDALPLGNGSVLTATVEAEDWDAEHRVKLVVYSPLGYEIAREDGGVISNDFSYMQLAPLTAGGALLVGAVPTDGPEAALVMRVDDNAETVWRREIHLGQDSSAVMAAQAGEAIYVFGNTKTTASYDDPVNVWVRKFDLDGTLIWQRTVWSGKNAYAGDIVATDDGGAILLGAGNGADPQNRPGSLARIAPDGSTVWQTGFELATYQSAYSLAQLPDGEIVVAGEAQAYSTLDGSAAVIVWFTADGREITRALMGTRHREKVYEVTPTHDGGVIVAGSFDTTDAKGSYDSTAWVRLFQPRRKMRAAMFGAQNSPVLDKCLSHGPDYAEPDRAKATCSLAASVFPDNAEAHYGAGRARERLGETAAAISAYTGAAERDHAEAMLALGQLYLDGPKDVKNAASAVKWLQKAMAEGKTEAARRIAPLYAEGRGTAKNPGKAAAAYRMAADAGDAESQYRLARAYRFATGLTANPEKARQYYQKAANQSHAAATGELAAMYHWGSGIGQDRYAAKTLYQKAAELGHADSVMHVADAYRYGDDVTQKNDRLAARWYKKATDLDIPRAYGHLGFMYELGLGVTKDMAHAAELYELGAKRGATNAEYNLAYVHEFGRGVKKDYAKAVRYYKRAIEDDHSGAMVRFGYMLRDGKGVPENKRQAFEMFHKAANLGSTSGNREAGWLKTEGSGTGKDVIGGIALIKKAVAKGDGLAEVYLGYIYEHEAAVKNPRRAARYYYDGLGKGEDWPVTRSKNSWDRRTARELQKLLKAAGHYKGAIDGSMGPGSNRAMKALCKCG